MTFEERVMQVVAPSLEGIEALFLDDEPNQTGDKATFDVDLTILQDIKTEIKDIQTLIRSELVKEVSQLEEQMTNDNLGDKDAKGIKKLLQDYISDALGAIGGIAEALDNVSEAGKNSLKNIWRILKWKVNPAAMTVEGAIKLAEFLTVLKQLGDLTWQVTGLNAEVAATDRSVQNLEKLSIPLLKQGIRIADENTGKLTNLYNALIDCCDTTHSGIEAIKRQLHDLSSGPSMTLDIQKRVRAIQADLDELRRLS